MASNTKVFFGDEARAGYMKGINALADAVVATLGPKGRTVLLSSNTTRPVITKDGVSVAKAIRLADPIEDAGAQLLRNVASSACSNAGDGTTTATLLARALVVEGHRLVAAGYDPIMLKQGVDDALHAVVEYLRATSRPCTTLEELQSVATISANGDTVIGHAIGEAVFKVGEHGIINVREGTSLKDQVEMVSGMIVDSGAISNNYMPHNGRPWSGSALVLISSNDISSPQETQVILSKIEEFYGEDRVIIIAPTFGEDFEHGVSRFNRGTEQVMLVKTPGFGSTKTSSEQDLAVYTGGTVVGVTAGIAFDDIQPKHFGIVSNATVTRKTTVLEHTNEPEIGEAIRNALENIQYQIDNADSEFARRNARDRYARLTGTVCNFVVGGTSELDVKERRDRIDDAIGAAQAARSHGILPGGGIALAMASKAVLANSVAADDVAIGRQLLMKVLRQPMSQLAVNAGQHPDVIAYRIEAASEKFEVPGWDASTDQIVDMFEAGIIDPTQVTVGSLTTAISVASLLLITEAVIVSDVVDVRA